MSEAKPSEALIAESQALAIRAVEDAAEKAVDSFLTEVMENFHFSILAVTGVLDPKAKCMEILVKKAKEKAFA